MDGTQELRLGSASREAPAPERPDTASRGWTRTPKVKARSPLLGPCGVLLRELGSCLGTPPAPPLFLSLHPSGPPRFCLCKFSLLILWTHRRKFFSPTGSPLEFLQAYIKGITIHFLPNTANAPWEASRPGIKAFTPLIRSDPLLRARNANSPSTLQSLLPAPWGGAAPPGAWSLQG